MSPLEEILHYQFRDATLLQKALCHKSYANEGRKRGQPQNEFVQIHNERIEFLGDAVLGLVMSDILSELFPCADEGMLSKMRSSLVKESTLAKIARELRLGDYLMLGKGEASSQGKDKDSILSSTYEAILGAIYLDGSIAPVFHTVKTHFRPLLDEVQLLTLNHDTKTQLQETCQAKYRKSPTYKVVAEEGPDHEKVFEVMVSVKDLKRYGKGRSKKEAEQVAAKFLLDHLMTQESGSSHAEA